MIIVIEGVDGTGKNTQSTMLADTINRDLSLCIKANKVSFPQYTEFFGKEIANYLNGNFGQLDEIHPKLCSLLYACDRQHYFFNNGKKVGQILIFDRYVPSNIAHQCAKLPESEQAEFQKWLENLEYVQFELPKPDLVIFLDVPVNISTELVLTKDKRNYTDKAKDLHEADNNYLNKAYTYFKKLASEEPNWVVINCLNENGNIKTIEEIHEIIKDVVYKYI